MSRAKRVKNPKLWYILMISREDVGRAHYLLNLSGEKTSDPERSLRWKKKENCLKAIELFNRHVGAWGLQAHQGIPDKLRRKRNRLKKFRTEYGTIKMREDENCLFFGYEEK